MRYGLILLLVVAGMAQPPLPKKRTQVRTKGAFVPFLVLKNPENIPPVVRFTTTPHRLVLEWSMDPEWPTQAFVVRETDLQNPKMNWAMSSTNAEYHMRRAPFTNYWHDVAIVLNTNRFEFVPSGAQSFHVSRLCEDGEACFEDEPLPVRISYK